MKVFEGKQKDILIIHSRGNLTQKLYISGLTPQLLQHSVNSVWQKQCVDY